MNDRVIQVNELARVEGEGALYVRINGDDVERVEFRIFEPPRFFEALLQSRMGTEAPDITSRICGICPIAYIMGACHAVEKALGIEVTPQIHALRRMIYCGEWIQSNTLHAAMLHAPDFLGLPSAMDIAKTNPELVRKALRVKKMGNTLMEVIGGRAVHPINTKVGGFYSAPDPDAIAALIPELEACALLAREITLDFAKFEFPDDDHDYLFVSLIHPDMYPILEGNIGSSRGLDIPPEEYPQHFYEEHVERSTALQGRTADGLPYLVGPLARYANNFEQLTDNCKATARDAGLGPVVRNPYQSILVRMIEVQYALEEAARLARIYEPPDPPSVAVPVCAGEGHGCTEAPRGICYHSYQLDDDGRITFANIVPPTSQNQPQIEVDLQRTVEGNLAMTDDDLQWRCEQTIRNYDPCISCSTHFLKLTVDRV